MKHKKQTPFIIVMMPHLIVIEDGVNQHDGTSSHEYPITLKSSHH